MRKLILLLLMLFPWLSSMAQSGLHSNKFFTEPVFTKAEGSKVSEVSGDALRDFNLSYYHGVSINSYKAALDYVVSLIEQDARQASNVEKSYRNGTLAFSILSFEGAKKNRYLIYSLGAKNNKPTITMVYAEGRATLDDIKRMLKKR